MNHMCPACSETINVTAPGSYACPICTEPFYTRNEDGRTRLVRCVPQCVPANGHQSHTAASKSRVTYVLLGLFLGMLGIHNFYAGYASRGVAQLLITLFLFWTVVSVFAVAIWVLIEVCTVDCDSENRRFI